MIMISKRELIILTVLQPEGQNEREFTGKI